MALTNKQLLSLTEPLEAMYSECVSRLIINLARHLKAGNDTANYEMRKLSELGAVTDESIAIIAQVTGSKTSVIKNLLSEALEIELSTLDDTLRGAIKAGAIQGTANTWHASQRVQTVLTNYITQAATDTNLVNTVMLNSTLERYIAAVNNVVSAEEKYRIAALQKASTQEALEKQLDKTQKILNEKTFSVVSGAESYTQAVRDSVKQLADNGITGFIDKSGREWTPEAYVSMDIKTTAHNTAIQGQKARSADYNVDTFQVSTKSAARPLCAPYQGWICSWGNWSGTVHDLYDNEYTVHPINSTSYGEAAGLFGINCGHTAETFIDGYSVPRYHELTPEEEKENAEQYMLSQEQRQIERDIRKYKTEALAYNVAGDKEAFDAAALKIKQKTADYRAFCKENNLTPRLERTQVGGYNRSVSSKVTQSAIRQEKSALANITMAVGDKLTEAEERVIMDYVSAKSYRLNAKLRAGETLTGDDADFKRNLDYALAKLPDYSGTVYRSISSEYIDDIDEFNKNHSSGRIVGYDAYTSTSKSVYDKTMDIQYVIQTKHGKDISAWNEKEQEVLHRRGTAFYITKRDGNTIYMEEI